MFIPLYPTQREMNHVWAGCLRCLEAGRCLQSPVQGGDTSLRVLPEVGRPQNWVVAVVTVNIPGNVSNVSNISELSDPDKIVHQYIDFVSYLFLFWGC